MPDAAGNSAPRGLVGERGPELHLPEDLSSLPVMAVLKGSPAWGLLRRLCDHGAPLPGQIVPVTEEELRSLREDVLIVCPAPARDEPEGR